MEVTFKAFDLEFRADAYYTKPTPDTFWAPGDGEECEILELWQDANPCNFLLDSILRDQLEREALLACHAAVKPRFICDKEE